MSPEITQEHEQIIFATAGYDHTIKIWQTHTGICQRTLQHAESQVNMLEITPDRCLLAAASYQHVRLFDLVSNNASPVLTYEGVPKNVTCVGFDEKGVWMYTGGEDGKVRIWDMKVSNCPSMYDVGAPITCVKLHPNQVELFIGDQNGNICIWNIKSNNSHNYMPDGDNMILDLAIDPDGKYLAAVNSKGRCYIWKMVDGDQEQTEQTILKPVYKFQAHSRHALRCKFSPDSSLLVTTSADLTAKIWDTGDYSKVLMELKAENQRWVWDAAFSVDSQYIFTGSSDNNARLWNVKTGKVERDYSGHQKAITTIAFRDVALMN